MLDLFSCRCTPSLTRATLSLATTERLPAAEPCRPWETTLALSVAFNKHGAPLKASILPFSCPTTTHSYLHPVPAQPATGPVPRPGATKITSAPPTNKTNRRLLPTRVPDTETSQHGVLHGQPGRAARRRQHRSIGPRSGLHGPPLFCPHPLAQGLWNR